MNNESNSIASARKKCAQQFAAWLTHLPELEEWEDRKNLMFDLNQVVDRLEREGRRVTPFLPNLQKITESVVGTLAEWTENAMKELNPTPPEWTPEQAGLEKVQELVDLMFRAAIPLEPSGLR